MNLFKFECIKLLRNKKTLALLSMTLLSLSFVLFQIDKQHQALVQNQFEQLEAFYNLAHHQRYEAYNEEDGSITVENQTLIAQLTTIKQTIKDLDRKRLADDWQEELALKIQFYQQTSSFLQAGGTFGDVSLDELAQNKMEQELLKQKNIKPTTIEAGQGGWYFVKFIADYWFSFFGALLLLLLCYDAYTLEKETRSLKFLFVQPFSKTTVFRSKLISNFIIITGLFLMITTLMFIIGTSRYGTGSLYYPIAYRINGKSAFTTLGSYLLNGFAIQGLFALFMLVYLFILSIWRNNSFEVLGFSLVSLLLPLVLFKEIPKLNKIAHWFPFYYFDVKSLLINRQSLALNYVVILLWLGLGILLLRRSIRRSANEFN